MVEPGAGAAADGRQHAAQPIVFDQAIAVAGLDQPLADLIAVKLTAGDQLKEPEGAAIECMVATAGWRCGECFDLAFERGVSVRIGLAIAPGA